MIVPNATAEVAELGLDLLWSDELAVPIGHAAHIPTSIVGTLQGLSMLRGEMSQANLKKLLWHCRCPSDVQPMKLLHCVFHQGGSGLEDREGEVALRQPTS